MKGWRKGKREGATGWKTGKEHCTEGGRGLGMWIKEGCSVADWTEVMGRTQQFDGGNDGIPQ